MDGSSAAYLRKPVYAILLPSGSLGRAARSGHATLMRPALAASHRASTRPRRRSHPTGWARFAGRGMPSNEISRTLVGLDLAERGHDHGAVRRVRNSDSNHSSSAGRGARPARSTRWSRCCARARGDSAVLISQGKKMQFPVDLPYRGRVYFQHLWNHNLAPRPSMQTATRRGSRAVNRWVDPGPGRELAGGMQL